MIRSGLRRVLRRAFPKAAAPTPAPSPGLEPSARLVLPTEGVHGMRTAGLRAALADGQPRIVHHWATWCIPCAEEIPRLVEASIAWRTRAALLSISWEPFLGGQSPSDAVRRVRAFCAENAFDWPTLVVLDPPSALMAELSMQDETVPQTWVLDGNGHSLLTRGALGPEDWDAIDACLGALDR